MEAMPRHQEIIPSLTILPGRPDPSLINIGNIRRKNTFSFLLAPPRSIEFPHNSLSEQCSLSTCIRRDASLMTVSAKKVGGDKIGANGRLAATDTAAAARSWRMRLVQMFTRVYGRIIKG